MRLSRSVGTWMLAIGLGGSLATYQMAPQWHAWWGLMDDAEFLGWAPRGQSLPARDYFATLATTEIGRIGNVSRFRPVYYVVKAAERVIWPASPSWYYAARTGMFALGLSLCAWALFISMGRVLGAGIFAIVSTEWFWRDIWAHGGPSEQYAFVGTSLLAAACAMAWTDAHAVSARRIALLAVVGTVLAMGSKENLLILVVPCAIVLLRLARTPEHRRTMITLLIIVMLLAAAIIAALVPGLRSAGSDINGHLIATNVRFAWLSAAPGRWLAAVIVTFAVLPFVSWRALPSARRTEDARARHGVLAGRLSVQIGLLLLLAISQLIFYAPTWPTFGSRYDFPGMLAFPLALASLTVFSLHWLTLAGVGTRAIYGVKSAAALAAVALALRHGIAPVREAAEKNTRDTQAIQAMLRAAVREAGHTGQRIPVVVEWQTPGDAEPANAVMRLLYKVGSDGPFFLRATSGAQPSVQLADVSRMALGGKLAWRDAAAAARAGGCARRERRSRCDCKIGRVWRSTRPSGERTVSEPRSGASRDLRHPVISVVVPAYNEETVLPEFLSRLSGVLCAIDDYEILVIDDGSTDGTLEPAIGAAVVDHEDLVIVNRAEHARQARQELRQHGLFIVRGHHDTIAGCRKWRDAGDLGSLTAFLLTDAWNAIPVQSYNHSDSSARGERSLPARAVRWSVTPCQFAARGAIPRDVGQLDAGLCAGGRAQEV